MQERTAVKAIFANRPYFRGARNGSTLIGVISPNRLLGRRWGTGFCSPAPAFVSSVPTAKPSELWQQLPIGFSVILSYSAICFTSREALSSACWPIPLKRLFTFSDSRIAVSLSMFLPIPFPPPAPQREYFPHSKVTYGFRTERPEVIYAMFCGSNQMDYF